MKTPTWISSNSTSILSGLACAGVVATVALAVRATPRAMDTLYGAKRDKLNAWSEDPDASDDFEDLTRVESVKAAWKDYLPTTVCGLATIGAIIASNKIGLRRNAALLGAYTLVNTAFMEYKDEVLKLIGEKKEQSVRDNIAEKHINENPPTNSQVIILGGGDQLCYDDLTGRYFQSDIEAIRRAEVEIRTRILKDMFVDHNEFYDILGLEAVTVGDALGWNIEHQPELIFSSHLSPDGRPCLSVQFRQLPKVDYLKY
jgi:Family of unknown function (DUF6353)